MQRWVGEAADGAVQLPTTSAAVVDRADVVVVGGGPAGVSAAVAAARNGADVVLLERYAYLGGMASGGFVLVLDDMVNGDEISVQGICAEYIERMTTLGLAVAPPPEDRTIAADAVARWTRWGLFDFHQPGKPKPIVYAVAFDPEGWKRVSNDVVRESGVRLRLHSWFLAPIMDGERIRGVVTATKSGPQAVLSDVVIDASGDADVAVTAGAPFMASTYLTTTVFRLGGVDVEEAERFEHEAPDQAAALNREAKRILGGSWDLWWLRTPLPGVVWCNAPHMSGYDVTRPEDQTEAEFEGRRRVHELLAFVRERMPGFRTAFLVDVAPQLGVRQSRLVQGDYVVTKQDIVTRRHFQDSVARGRDYYTPYRAMVPRGVEQLLVAGRHYSAEPAAQRISREIPPCMAMGEAAGVAATLSLEQGVHVRDVDVRVLQRRLRAQGADPGDVPAPNATLEASLAARMES